MIRHPHTEATRKLAILRQHLIAWDDAISAATLALSAQQDNLPAKYHRLERLMSFQAIVAYARPFTRGDGMEKPDHPGEAQLMALRHEISAHTDADGHVYLVDVRIENGQVVNEVPITVLRSYMPKVLAEAQKERVWAQEEIVGLEEKIGKQALPDGIYGKP